jgi:hypothetical protein
MDFINLADFTINPATIAFVDWSALDDESDEPGVTLFFIHNGSGSGVLDSRLFFLQTEPAYTILAAYFKRI